MWIERIALKGLRSFGSAEQSMDLSPRLTIIYADNSNGKTSLAEAIEFLLTGTISRKSFTGSASREFADSLRNVHLQPGEGSHVSATLSVAGQRPRVVTRRLTGDFGASRECTSQLDIDGAAAATVAPLIRLSEPPLQTPILLQHSLRYVLSARPQDRSAYFKAILDVTDLDELHQVLTSMASEASPRTPLVLRAVAALPGLTVGGRFVELELRELIVSTLGGLVGAPGGSPQHAVEAKAAEFIAESEARRFPFRDVVLTGANVDRLDVSVLDRAAAAARISVSASDAEAAMQRFLEAALALPAVDPAATTDCPLCLADDSLTPARVQEIQRSIASSREVLQARERLDAELGLVRRWRDEIRSQLRRATPRVLEAQSDDVRTQVDRALLALLVGGESAAQIDAWRISGTALDAALGQAATAEQTLTDLVADRDTRADSIDEVISRAREVDAAVAAVNAAADSYRSAFAPLETEIRNRLSQDAEVARVRELLALLPAVADLAIDLESVRVHESRTRFLREAADQVEAATKQLLDEKFGALSGEMSTWWNMMRPDELSMFAGLQRAGTGRRYMDIKARLLGDTTGQTSEERDAAAVFSDSQLNCLGLSAFLARISREQADFVVLDDPIQASDEGHRYTFVNRVPEALIASGKQVILLTHDQRLARDLQDRYEHLEPAHFRLSLADPRVGTVITTVKDSLQLQIQRAGPLAADPSPDSRRQAAQLLRTAAERFCKKVLVKVKRATGASALLSDHDGQTLGPLITDVSPHLTRDASHPGKLRVIANTLNPGNHDDGAPNGAALRGSLGDLNSLASIYL